jgi:hypothetical protein
MARSLRSVKQKLRRGMHMPLRQQHALLAANLRGHYSYFGITGNMRKLRAFYEQVKRLWFRSLRHRSNRSHRTWDWFTRLLTHYPLPQPRVVHSALLRR